MDDGSEDIRNHLISSVTPESPRLLFRAFLLLLPTRPPDQLVQIFDLQKKKRNIGILLQILAKFYQAPEGISPDLDTSLVSMFLFLAIFLHGVSGFFSAI
jgi:hypothetical protein